MVYNDLPIDSIDQDKFGRANFAVNIANVIDNWDDSNGFTLGIYGSWGEGKSSVLNMISSYLAKNENNIIVKFNPWRFSNEVDLLIAFFNTLTTSIEKKIDTSTESLGKLIKEYAEIVLPKLSFFGFSIDLGKSAKELGLKLSETEIEEIKKRVAKLLIDSQKKIIVIIDDIDRLEKKEMQAVFKLVKLTADFKYTIYLLAFDDQIVSNSLAEVYGKGIGDAGYEYLEKIIQVPLRIPKASKNSLNNYALEMLEKLLHNEKISIHPQDRKWYRVFFEKYHLPFVNNPRTIVRFVNALKFSLTLLDYNEICVLDLLVIEGVRLFYPELYHWIGQNPDFLVGYNKFTSENEGFVEKEIEIVLSKYDAKSVYNAKSILANTFPTCFDLYKYQEGDQKKFLSFTDEKMKHKAYERKRIYSPFFFNRYFSLTVDQDEIPQSILDIIKHLASAGNDSLYYINLIVDGYGIEILLDRLKFENFVPDNIDGAFYLIRSLEQFDSLYLEKDENYFSKGRNLYKEYLEICLGFVSGLGSKEKKDLLNKLIIEKSSYSLINNLLGRLFTAWIVEMEVYSKRDPFFKDRLNGLEAKKAIVVYNNLLSHVGRENHYIKYLKSTKGWAQLRFVLS